jgi:multidrug efflux pump subunit AcrA (membrane-fusion protein)
VIGADDHARAVGVTTGIADDRFTEVTGGLREGDRVITALHRSAPPAPTGSAPSFAPARRAH